MDRLPCRAEADWLDPLVGLSFVAAATLRIEIATGVLLLPEHNPVLLAKQAASLDALSGGRLTLGVGVGWSREEFAALGVSFERRGERATEYVAAMRTLWREDVATFDGEFVAFDSVRVNPKPIRSRRIPVVVGGNSDAALRRVAAWGDGWYGFNLAGVEAVRERVGVLRELCREEGRDVRELRLAVALDGGEPGDIPALAELGVNELVLVETPPEDPAAAADWVDALARRWKAADAYGRASRYALVRAMYSSSPARACRCTFARMIGVQPSASPTGRAPGAPTRRKRRNRGGR